MTENPARDILVRVRQQASVCKAQGYPETHAFLTELGDEIERLRMRLAVVGAADAQAGKTASQSQPRPAGDERKHLTVVPFANPKDRTDG